MRSTCKGATMFKFQSVVRGYHVYKDIIIIMGIVHSTSYINIVGALFPISALSSTVFDTKPCFDFDGMHSGRFVQSSGYW